MSCCGGTHSRCSAQARIIRLGLGSLARKPPHYLNRSALVHGDAHQLARGIEHFPISAALLALDRVAGLRGGGGSLGLALLGHRGLRSS